MIRFKNMESKEFREFILGVYILGIWVNMSKKGFFCKFAASFCHGVKIIEQFEAEV